MPHRILDAKECEQLKLEIVDKIPEMTWGTFGPDGDQPLQYKPLAELDTDHLENILISQPTLNTNFKAAIVVILKNRYKSA